MGRPLPFGRRPIVDVVTVVVLAPDSFKGSLPAAAVAQALAEGWAQARPVDTCLLRPMADGGEGTLNAFASAHPESMHMPITVLGPHDRRVEASWLWLPPTEAEPGGVGVVELATTSGIGLLDDLRPESAHTEGLGQAVAAALDHGVSRVIVGLGSSASTDGGLGFLRALGARALDHDGRPVARGLAGLRSLATLDLHCLRALPPNGVDALTDVTSPLLGQMGAAAVFGPQKGLAAADEIREADRALERLAGLVDGTLADAPGAGAAGGTGFALLAWGARVTSGAAAVADLLGLPAAIATADVVVTGEGRFDRQSLAGKVPARVGELARQSGCRVMLVAGEVADDADHAMFDEAVSLVGLAGARDAALADPSHWLREAGRRLAGSW